MLSVENYNKNRGVYSPLMEHNGIICGFWLCGQNYRNPTQYYGAYPPSYLKRMGWLFPDHEDYQVLHLFSGKTPPGTWKNEYFFDSNIEVLPDYPHNVCCGNAENLSEFTEGMSFDLIASDPPYDLNYIKYGTPKVNKKKVIKECAKVLEIGGHLIWLDTIIPIWSKADGWKLRGTIGLIQSTNHKCRVATIFEKVK
jgi:hypothetical protein